MCSTSINGVKIAAEASQGVKIDSMLLSGYWKWKIEFKAQS